MCRTNFVSQCQWVKYPFKVARRDAIARLKFFRGFESELQTNPMPFHIDSPCGSTLVPLTACAMDWGQNRIPRVGRNSGPILSRLWTKVHETCGKVEDPLYIPTPLSACLYHVSFRRYSQWSLEVVEKPNKCKSYLASNFLAQLASQPAELFIYPVQKTVCLSVCL